MASGDGVPTQGDIEGLSPQASQTVVGLLRDILDQQRAQLHVQKTQLAVLRGHPHHQGFGHMGVVYESKDECTEERKERLTDFDELVRSITEKETCSGPLVWGDSGFDELVQNVAEVQTRSRPLSPNSDEDDEDEVSGCDEDTMTHVSTKMSFTDMLASTPRENRSSPDDTVRSVVGVRCSTALPKGLSMATSVLRQLTAAAVLSKEMLHHTRMYKSYCICFAVAQFLHSVLLIKNIVLNLMGDDLHGDFVYINVVLLVMQSVLWHPLWLIWTKEFEKTGPTFGLMQQMDRRGFTWSDLNSSIHKSNIVSVMAVVAVVGVWFYSFSTGHSNTQVYLQDNGSQYSQVMGRLSAVIDIVGIPSQILACGVAPTHVWIVYLVACLHRHDLLCYASAMVKVLETDGEEMDFVPALNKVEVVVTARLRLASARWVNKVVFHVVCLCIIVLVTCMFLLTSENIGYQQLILYSFIAFFGFVFISALCAPLAMVSETFDYDVLRTLNNPLILKAAQKHVGQQLLAHLTHLDWGFRLGGSTITAKMFVNVAAGVLITLVTSVSQAAFNQTLNVEGA